MASDVFIERCTLRVARRGGWSWGADPGALLRAALQALPGLIGERLGAAWPEGVDRTIAAPLRLRLALRPNDLRALAETTDAARPGAASIGDALGQRIDDWIRELVQRETGSDPVLPGTSPLSGARAIGEPEPRSALPAASVLAVLLRWLQQGQLMDALLTFAPATLAAWYERLLRELSDSAPMDAGASIAGALDALVQEFEAWPVPLAPGRRAGTIRRVGLLVAAVQRFGTRVWFTTLCDAMRARAAFALPPQTSALTDVSAPDSDAPVAAAPASTDVASASRSAHTPPIALGPAPRTASRTFELRVPCALPFLMLGPLSRTGYLQAVSAVFEAGELPREEMACLATALARKVLDAPQRGWYREAGAISAAAALSARETGPTDGELATFGRHLAPHLTPLDAAVASSLTGGHSRGAALLLRQAESGGTTGWLLFEADGVFPIAWSERLETLFPRLAALGGEILLVPQDAPSSALLTRLDDAGFRFVTDAAPGRGESWRGLHHEGLRAWSNDRESPTGALLAAARQLESAGFDSAALWSGLAVQRPALPAGGEAGVERSLVLAAALGLGSIAWQLWGGGVEPVSPLLALQRFADFDARVVVGPDRIQVHLPLGRRFLDLEQAGLLEDVVDVPWLDGRPIRFARG